MCSSDLSYIFLYNNQKYKLIYPDVNIKYEAELYAQDEYENNKFNDWIQEDQIIDCLISIGLWSYNGDQNLKNLEKQIEDLKVDIYDNFLNPKKVKSLKKSIENIQETYNRQYNLRHSLDAFTTNGYSQHIKNQYILIYSLFDSNNNRIFQSIEDADPIFLNNISNKISENIIEISTFRTIARSDIWKNYWSANNDVFDRAS